MVISFRVCEIHSQVVVEVAVGSEPAHDVQVPPDGKALELMACDPTPKGCESEWEYEFICPIKLIEYVVAETIKEVAFRLQIPVSYHAFLKTILSLHKTMVVSCKIR